MMNCVLLIEGIFEGLVVGYNNIGLIIVYLIRVDNVRAHRQKTCDGQTQSNDGIFIRRALLYHATAAPDRVQENQHLQSHGP